MKFRILGLIFIIVGIGMGFTCVNMYKTEINIKQNYVQVTGNLTSIDREYRERKNGKEIYDYQGIYEISYNNKTYTQKSNNVYNVEYKVPKTKVFYVNKKNPKEIAQITPTFVYIIMGLMSVMFPITGLRLLFSRGDYEEDLPPTKPLI